MPEICRFLGIVIYMLYDDHRRRTFTRSMENIGLPWRSPREL
jgi:hypothetical protein